MRDFEIIVSLVVLSLVHIFFQTCWHIKSFGLGSYSWVNGMFIFTWWSLYTQGCWLEDKQCASFASDIWNEGNCGFGRCLKTCASWFMSSLVDSMSGSCLEFQFSLSHAIPPVRMVDIQH